MEITRQIESFATRHFPLNEIRYRWSAQDYMTLDRVPYIGPISPFSDGIYVVTGFGGWGMTHGTVAGLLLSDLVTGRDNEWERLYTPNRVPPLRSLKRVPKAGTNMMKQFRKGYRNPQERTTLPDLKPGEGKVVNLEGEKVAVSRDSDGELRAVSGTCTYSGCVLSWNSAGETWDCPCHGSRYTADGQVIDGPAQRDLPQRDVPDRSEGIRTTTSH